MKYPNNMQTDIVCPHCKPPRFLVVKTNRATDHQFLGCPNYPECDYTRGIPEEWKMREAGQVGLFDELQNETENENVY